MSNCMAFLKKNIKRQTRLVSSKFNVSTCEIKKKLHLSSNVRSVRDCLSPASQLALNDPLLATLCRARNVPLTSSSRLVDKKKSFWSTLVLTHCQGSDKACQLFRLNESSLSSPLPATTRSYFPPAFESKWLFAFVQWCSSLGRESKNGILRAFEAHMRPVTCPIRRDRFEVKLLQNNANLLFMSDFIYQFSIIAPLLCGRYQRPHRRRPFVFTASDVCRASMTHSAMP